jgi:DNA-binding CsgD family transcriptional regulator
VALLLAERRSNTEIAGALGISPHTAKRHTERVLGKLGVSTRRAVGTVVCVDAVEPQQRAV